MKNAALVISMDLTTQELEIELKDPRLPVNKARKKLEQLPRLINLEKRRMINEGKVGQPLDPNVGGVQTVTESDEADKPADTEEALLTLEQSQQSQEAEDNTEGSEGSSNDETPEENSDGEGTEETETDPVKVAAAKLKAKL